MTHSITSTTSSAGPGYSPSSMTGPIVAAVGGVDPDSVLRAARALAPSSAGVVVAAAVVPPLVVAVPGESAWMVPSGYELERFEDSTSELSKRLATLGDAATSWTKRVIPGTPAVAITDLAREQHAAVLIVGIGRHRPIDRLFGSETALGTIQRAPCPVLVVHPDFEGPFHDVVIATDFCPASVAAAQAAMPMLGPAATLHVVHVWQPHDALDSRTLAADEAYLASLPESFRRFTEVLAVPPGVTVRTEIREGKVAERVLDYAGSHRADLVTAGRHGRNLLQRLFVGSQTTALVRAAGRSVLIAPEPPFAERDRLRLVLTGSTQSSNPAEWDTQLRTLSQRTFGRPAVLQVDDLMFGLQHVETGFVMLGASCEPGSRKVELSLGDAAVSARRVTRRIGTVDAIAIDADDAGRDHSLLISHGGGQTSLTFLDH